MEPEVFLQGKDWSLVLNGGQGASKNGIRASDGRGHIVFQRTEEDRGDLALPWPGGNATHPDEGEVLID